MDELVFEGPPPPRASRPELREVAQALRARPGEWARVGQFVQADMLAANIKRGKPVVFAPKGSFEAVSRRINGEFFLYARYVGEAGNQEAGN